MEMARMRSFDTIDSKHSIVRANNTHLGSPRPSPRDILPVAFVFNIHFERDVVCIIHLYNVYIEVRNEFA